MVITRSPFRISFFGGGTDYPAYYENNAYGAVLSTSIDKYCYISCRYLPPFFSHKTRVVWSQVENINHASEVKNPVVREVMLYKNIPEGLAINYDGDLPARSGLGSSSSFAVGLLHALSVLRNEGVSKYQLANDAIHIERERLGESVGSQDQASAAFGGFNKILFKRGGEIEVQSGLVPEERLKILNEHLALFYTGVSRIASEVASEQIANTPLKTSDLARMRGMVDDGLAILQKGSIEDFGGLLHEAWMIKRGLSSKISNDSVDAIYEKGRANGAIGGKLLGAGGGGFILFFVRPQDRQKLISSLRGYLHVPFVFETGGSKLIYSDES